jgi:hypothetical protein
MEVTTMDFQRLFKRKPEGPAPPFASDDAGDTLKDKDVIIREGELLDGNSPAPVDWAKVGGAITIKAGKILGVMEGRTRIKAEVLEELYPDNFTRPLNPEVEYSIPLRVVVMQIQDFFGGPPLADTKLEGLETPFGDLAREDEARLKKGQRDQQLLPQPALPNSFDQADEPGEIPRSTVGNLSGKRDSDGKLKEQPSPINGVPLARAGTKEGLDGDRELQKAEPPRSVASAGTDSSPDGSKQPKPATERLKSGPEIRNPPGKTWPPLSEVRPAQSHHRRRQGHERLQELYLTDEPLDGAKIAELVMQLPRVTGVVIMLIDGAVLGGELGEGLTDELVSLVPAFVKHVSGFTEVIPGSSTRFITFFADTLQISLVIGGEVLMLIGHEGKNLPPGLRERLLGTTQALNLIYGSQS